MSLLLDRTTPVKVIGFPGVIDDRAVLKVKYTNDGETIIEAVDADRLSGRGEVDLGNGKTATLDMGR